jgi:DNA topoisomerase-1
VRDVVRVALTRRRGVAALPLEPEASAKIAGLHYVNDAVLPGIRRVGSKHRVRYVLPNGATLGDREELQRIKALVIPPAWTDVWICPRADGHLQATGRDARGRKQYRYHARWREVRDEVKYGRLLAFAGALERIRERTDADIQRQGLPREKVLALVVQLLEKTLIRVGNEEYARDNGSIGLTTMRDAHAKIHGPTIRFEFKGKSGIKHAIALDDSRLARVVKSCRDLPGHELFQYVADDGTRCGVDSSDVNAYLKEIAGEEFTAKDFRTWAGTVLAACELSQHVTFRSQAEAKRRIVSAIDVVARRLGNTKAVSRKCYIHPAVLDAFLEREVIKTGTRRVRRRHGALSDEERAVVRMLERRLARTATAGVRL